MYNGILWKLYIAEKVKIVEPNDAICNLQNMWGIQIQITHSIDKQSKNNIKWQNRNPLGLQAQEIKYSQSSISLLVS